jgi:hypothetical protein
MIGDVDRQQAADVGHVDGDRPGPVPGPAEGVDPRILARLAVLAEQVHLVAELRERRGDAGVVDVAAGSPQQVAVKDQDLDAARLLRVEAAKLCGP